MNPEVLRMIQALQGGTPQMPNQAGMPGQISQNEINQLQSSMGNQQMQPGMGMGNVGNELYNQSNAYSPLTMMPPAY